MNYSLFASIVSSIGIWLQSYKPIAWFNIGAGAVGVKALCLRSLSGV